MNPDGQQYTPQRQSAQPQRPPTRRRYLRARRAGATALLGMALVGAGATGGALGARYLGPERAASPAVAAAPAGGGAALTTQPLQSGAAQGRTVAGQVYDRAGGAVVEIQTTSAEGQQFGIRGGGTGFVVDAAGLILTNNHVVDRARSVTVEFATGEERTATVLGRSPANDLALLRVENLPRNIPVAALGDSDAAQVGETAVAIGSPYGLEGSVSQGIVSAVGRNYGPLRDLIQTDAPINPGNSGGPLFNARGEVIGITTLNESPIRGSVGVGFAVPINTAKQILPQLEAGETVERAWIGIAGADLDAETARAQDLPVNEGVLVLQVVEGSPAARAGLRGGSAQDGQPDGRLPEGGDVITAVDGQAVGEMGDFADRLAAKRPGDRLRLTINRDGDERRITVTLGAWPEEEEQR